MAKITLWGMAKWMEESDDDLFSKMEMPEGIDKDLLIGVIMQEGAEFETLYADPTYMQYLIGIWAQKHNRTFAKWAELLEMEYNPLENYDRMEDWTDNGSRQRRGSGVRAGSEQGSRSQDGLQVSHVGTTAGEETTNRNNTSTVTVGDKDHGEDTENKVSAYNVSTYQPKDRSEASANDHDAAVTNTQGNGGSTVDGTTSADEQKIDRQNGSDTRSSSETHSDTENEQHGTMHHGRVHGNIGVTTAMQMVEAQFSVVRLNIYTEAANLFLDEFTLRVY